MKILIRLTILINNNQFNLLINKVKSHDVQSNHIESNDESYLTNSGWQNPIRRFFLPFIGLVRTSTSKTLSRRFRCAQFCIDFNSSHLKCHINIAIIRFIPSAKEERKCILSCLGLNQ